MTQHEIERLDDTLVVRLRHSLTHKSSDHFHDVLALLRDGDIRRCDLHLQDLDFIDSQGLALLLTAGQIAESKDMCMRLVSPRGEVKERLNFVRMGERVAISYP